MRCPGFEHFPLMMAHKSQVNEGVIFNWDEVDFSCPYLRSVYNHDWLEMVPNILSHSD